MAAEPQQGNLRRLFALWGVATRMDLLWLANPSAAITWYVSEGIAAVSTVTSTFLIATRFDGIGVWSQPQIIFMLGFALLVRGVVEAVFGMNIAFISRRIGRGQLDHMLLQPQPLWLTVLSDGFTPCSGAGMLVAGGAVLVWSGRALHLSLSFGWVVGFLLQLVAAAVIVIGFTFAWGSLAFYAPRGAEELNSESMLLLRNLSPFPLDGMGSALRLSLLSVVPAGFLAWLPSRALLGLEPGRAAWLTTPLTAGVFLVLAVLIFQRGLRHYRTTGSTRYMAHGHRR
jgi:ABC-2 type transport system permease protein